jgi:hypothetical protein
MYVVATITRKLWIDRDTTNWKIQAELWHFKQGLPFTGYVLTVIGSKLTVFYKNGYHFTILNNDFIMQFLPENVKI